MANNTNLDLRLAGAAVLLGAMIFAIGCAASGSSSLEVLTNERQEAPIEAQVEDTGPGDWGALRSLITDLIMELPAVDHPDPLSERLSLHRIGGTLIACGLWHGVLFDEGHGRAWAVRSSGFVGVIEYFGPIDYDDPRIQEFRRRSQPVSIESIPLASGL